jgi:sporulation protein YlmC with PRC-barrel domain
MDKQIELLQDSKTSHKIQELIGDDGVYVLGYTVYDRDGNYVATLTDTELA